SGGRAYGTSLSNLAWVWDEIGSVSAPVPGHISMELPVKGWPAFLDDITSSFDMRSTTQPRDAPAKRVSSASNRARENSLSQATLKDQVEHDRPECRQLDAREERAVEHGLLEMPGRLYQRHGPEIVVLHDNQAVGKVFQRAELIYHLTTRPP